MKGKQVPVNIVDRDTVIVYIQTNCAKQAGGFYFYTKFYANKKVPAITHCYSFGVSVSQKPFLAKHKL